MVPYLAVEARGGGVCVGGRGEFDEAEAAGHVRVLVARHEGVLDGADVLEVGRELRVGDGEGEVADEDGRLLILVTVGVSVVVVGH